MGGFQGVEATFLQPNAKTLVRNPGFRKWLYGTHHMYLMKELRVIVPKAKQSLFLLYS